MLSRKQALLESCAAQFRDRLAELLDRLRVPAGADLLQAAISFVEETLVDLADECSDEVVKNFRDTSRYCLKLLARSRELSDESHRHADKINADLVYKAFALLGEEGSWERETLRVALLLLVLKGEPRPDDEKVLVSAINSPKIISDFQAPANAITRLRAYSQFLRVLSATDRGVAQLGEIVERVTADLLSAVVAPESYELSDEETTAIANCITSFHQPGQELTHSEALKKEVVKITTRICSAIRHLHRPLVHFIPDLTEARRFIANLYRKDKEIAQWATVHVLLSAFALPLLAIPTRRPMHSRVTVSPDGLVITAPRLRKRSKANPPNPAFEIVHGQITLPLPVHAARIAANFRARGPEFAEEAHKTYGLISRSFGDEEGFRIRLNAMHRLLPLFLGDGKAVDPTLLHLLSLREVQRRDAGIHYFSPSSERLVRVYQEGMAALASALDLSSWIDEGWTQPPSPSECFGASARPSLTFLIRLVDFLRDRAAQGRGNRSIDSRIAACNAQAAFVVVMNLAATGARPVGDVFPSAAAWDAEGCVTLASEKDSLLYRSTRLLVGPARLKAEIEELRHRRLALEVLLGRRFDPDRIVTLLTPDSQELPPTIANLRELIPGFKEHWPWPNDILRHHFRSRLWELGVDAATLDDTMGHFPKSGSPDTSLATRQIDSSARRIHPLVDSLLDEMGY